MELEQLRFFIAAAEAGSLSAAARELYVSHSTVSRAISALEASLGVRLLERGGRGAEPTAAGRELLGGGRELLAAAAELERRVKDKETDR